MRPIEEFCKARTPDGLSYSCKQCRAKENKELCHARHKRYMSRPLNRVRSLFNSRKRDAVLKNLEFSITLEDVVIPDTCPVLGIPLYFSETRTHNTPSIDRIDNTKGYTTDNIVIISWRANMLKKDATIDELKKLSAFYEELIASQ